MTYLRKTRIENAEELIEEIDSENLKREQSIERAKKTRENTSSDTL